MSADFDQALAILTRQASRLVQAAPHSEPGQVPLMLAALESHAMKLTEARLMTIPQLDEFFGVTHTVTHTNLAMVYLTEPSVERERIQYIQRRCAEDLAHRRAAAATVQPPAPPLGAP